MTVLKSKLICKSFKHVTHLVELHHGLDEGDRLAGPRRAEDDEGGVVVLAGVVGDDPADGLSLLGIGPDVLMSQENGLGKPKC